MENKAFLNQIFLRSLTPFEVLEYARKYTCEFGDTDVSYYLNYWKSSVSKKASDEAFESYLHFHGISDEEVLSMVSPVIGIKEEFNLPAWVDVLRSVFEDIDAININQSVNPEEKPFFQLFSPFIETFTKSFKEQLSTEEIPVPSEKVLTQLQDYIHKELFILSNTVLFEEFSSFKRQVPLKQLQDGKLDSYYQEFITTVLSDQYQRLWMGYPILARKMATRLQNYILFTTSLFKRLEQDRKQVNVELGIDIEVMENITLSAGDQHHGGSTTILTFEHGQKLIYKPSDASITQAYNQFLGWVNEQLHCDLRSFRAINKKTYSWLEFVEHIPCKDKSEVQRYYERAGILAGLAYFLNATDYHYENLIASGDCPILIDHETIIGPDLKQLGDPNSTNQDYQYVLKSVLKSNLLPIKKMNIPNHICGFGSSVNLSTVDHRLKVKDINQDSMGIVREKIFRKLYKYNKPLLNGKAENLDHYQTEFKNGFQAVYQLMIREKVFLNSKESPFQVFKNLRLRFINRITSVYMKILNGLNNQEYLRNPIKYGLKLELMAKAYEALGSWSPILKEERFQMLQGDVPVFDIDSCQSELFLKDGQLVDIIGLSAIEAIYEKVNRASSSDLSYQMNLIEEVIEL